MKGKIDVLLVGVGGQGTILASKVVSTVALGRGYDVKMSEIHGMAQRGGSVVTHLRMAEKVYSPLIEAGQANYMVAFEQLEALRWLHFLHECGTIIVNTQRIKPMTVITSAATYPAAIGQQIAAVAHRMVCLDALSIALDLRIVRFDYVFLLGALAHQMDFPQDDWLQALEASSPPRFLALNKRAFEAGLCVNWRLEVGS